MPDYAAQRLNMIESQVRTNDVADPRIVAAFAAVPRERFVPEARRALAYADSAVEVAPGRYLLDPRTFSKLIKLAGITAGDSILDVGCATGYSSAILSRLGKSVVALEQDADLVRAASDLLPAVGAAHVTVVQGGLVEGFRARAPYDVIFVNGGIEDVPPELLDQLAEGGRLVAVVQKSVPGRGTIFVREHGRAGAREVFDATVPVLSGFRKAVGFVF